MNIKIDRRLCPDCLLPRENKAKKKWNLDDAGKHDATRPLATSLLKV